MLPNALSFGFEENVATEFHCIACGEKLSPSIIVQLIKLEVKQKAEWSTPSHLVAKSTNRVVLFLASLRLIALFVCVAFA